MHTLQLDPVQQRPAAQAASAAALLLRTPASGMLGTPAPGSPVAVPMDELGRAVAARLGALAPSLRLAGALPFDRQANCHLLPVQVQADNADMDD